MPEPTSKRETGRPQVAPTGGVLSPLTATQRGEASTQSARANPGERRNLASRQILLRRIAMEYDEMPGLCLTAPQAQRLFGLREDICVRVFNALVDAAILRRDVSGVYRRNGGGPWKSSAQSKMAPHTTRGRCVEHARQRPEGRSGK